MNVRAIRNGSRIQTEPRSCPSILALVRASRRRTIHSATNPANRIAITRQRTCNQRSRFSGTLTWRFSQTAMRGASSSSSAPPTSSPLTVSIFSDSVSITRPPKRLVGFAACAAAGTPGPIAFSALSCVTSFSRAAGSSSVWINPSTSAPSIPAAASADRLS